MPTPFDVAPANPWPSDTTPYEPDNDQDSDSGTNRLLGGAPSQTHLGALLFGDDRLDGGAVGGPNADVDYGAPSNDPGPTGSLDWTGASTLTTGASRTPSIPTDGDDYDQEASNENYNSDTASKNPSLVLASSSSSSDRGHAAPTGRNISNASSAHQYNSPLPKDGHGGRTPSGDATSPDWSQLDHSPLAKAAVGEAALWSGGLPGVARGAWHTAEDIYNAADFGSRLTDPVDILLRPRGHSAWEEALQAGEGVFDYTQNALLHPKVISDDLGAALHRFQVSIDPSASPQADTIGGEWDRNFNIGMNRGETLFDVGSLFVGAGELKGLAALGKTAESVTAAKYLARGYPRAVSNYFAKPYKGAGHHFLPRRTKLPELLGGGPVPPAISNSPFFLLKPPNISTGDFFERHFQVDPYYYGGKVPREFGGGGWSGKTLGWDKYDRLGRLWYGSPTPLKAAAGAGVVGAGAAVDQIPNNRRRP
jgi:hypothetical protein